MNRVKIQVWQDSDKQGRIRQFGLALGLLALLYIAAVIAFIVVY
jgi:hypothetical protein